MFKFWSKRGTLPTDYSKVYLRFVCVCQDLVAAERNLGQFFVLGDCWFFVHLPSPTGFNWIFCLKAFGGVMI